MIARDPKNRLRFMPAVSKMMAVVLTAVTVLTASPGAGHATPAAPQITSASAEVNSNNTAVTVTFNTYAQPAGSLADLMDDIQIERSDSEQWVDLAADSASNAISMNADGALVITLGTALNGTSNNLQIAEGAVMNKEGVLSANVISVLSVAANDITGPVYTGSRSNDGSRVNLYFDEDFSLNLPDEATEEQADTFLASRISVAGDGEHFALFTNNEGSAYQSDSRELYLSYDNDMKIISGTGTVIRIASGTLKDAAGNLNAEMNLQVSPPVIQSAVVSNDNHGLEITFNKEVVNNTTSIDELKKKIYLVRTVAGQEKSFKALVALDTLSIDSGKLNIHFAEALSGTESQIVIGRGALKDLNGNVWDIDTVSGFLETAVGGVDPSPADTTMPRYLDYSVSDDYQNITFVFDEDIYNAMGNDISFLQNVQWYDPFRNQWVYTLPSDITFTFSGPKFTMHFPAPLTGSQYYYQFNPGHFKDASGNVLTDYVTTSNWITPQNPAKGISYKSGYFSGDGRFLSLSFKDNIALADQTLVDGVSHLRENITLSTDYGVTYSALDPLDVVAIRGSEIEIIFHNAKQQGSVKVKVSPGVISDLYDTKRNSAVEATIAYNTPEFTGYFFSNTDSEFVFADNAAWRVHVGTVTVYDDDAGAYRILNASEYELSEGKLTLARGIFAEGTKYIVSVDADGYSSKYFEGKAYKSSEVFYMTAPAVTESNGITASIRLFNNAYDEEVNGNQTIIFELFDGTTPVSIVSANLKLDTGTYSANFNVGDAAVNPNYTVKAYVVSRYGNDPANLGLNLATVKTPLELDLAILAANQNNNNNED